MPRLLRLLPLYASVALLTAALAAVAHARDWGGWHTLAVAAVGGVIYLAAVAVPWLLATYSVPRQPEPTIIYFAVHGAVEVSRGVVATSRIEVKPLNGGKVEALPHPDTSGSSASPVSLPDPALIPPLTA
jgi:hypothetical protein